MQKPMSINEDEADRKQEMVQAVRSRWPVRFVKKREDVEDSHLDTSRSKLCSLEHRRNSPDGKEISLNIP